LELVLWPHGAAELQEEVGALLILSGHVAFQGGSLILEEGNEGMEQLAPVQVTMTLEKMDLSF
jgi:hypothetical protein